MKKIISLILALVFVLCMSSVAFAHDVNDDTPKAQLFKNYQLVNEGTSPEESFSFTTPVLSSYPDGVNEDDVPKIEASDIENQVSYFDGGANKTDTDKKALTINLPAASEFPEVGVYIYKFNEVKPTSPTAGVGYHTADIELWITIMRNPNDQTFCVASIHAETKGNKIDTITNTYSAGKLTVKKLVTGAFGEGNKDFNVTVTFKKPEDAAVKSTISYTDGTANNSIKPEDWDDGTATATITLKKDESVTFTNIPYGVTYTVTEDDYSGDDYGYTTTVAVDNGAASNGRKATGTIDSAEKTITFTNNKGGSPDTGIKMDSLPYIVLLGVVVLAAVVMFLKRRTHND